MTIQDAMNKGEGEVQIRGWIYRERKSKKLAFIIIRDSSNIIQCVFEKNNFTDDQWDAIDKTQMETCMSVTGTIKKDDRAPSGYEIQATDFEIIGACDKFPIQKDQSPEFLLDNRHLWIRSRKMAAIMKIRHTVMGAIHEFFREKGFYEFTSPVLQPNQAEGGSTLFEVNYYGDKTYLSQTWQLYAEAAVFSLEKVYNVAPTFRAEKSKTSRHLSEFWMAEMEAAWYNLDDAVKCASEEIAFIVKKVLGVNKAELELLGRDISKLEKVKMPFPVITYTEALSQLKEHGMEVPWGKDLRTVEEEKLMELYETPVVVTHYPKEIMAFYKPKDPSDERVALCFDMLAPEGYGEIVGGSQRDVSIEEIEKALKQDGEDPEDYKFYLDLRRYGSVPHSGYGVGVERIIAWICGLDNIKDAIPFPRTMLRKAP